MHKRLAIGALALLTSACATTTTDRSAASTSATSARGSLPTPDTMQDAGTRSIIGQPASSLARRFGAPRIDLTEGDARKLQFASSACVLDIYLYPASAGATPVASHVQARQRKGGGAIERADCIEQVERER